MNLSASDLFRTDASEALRKTVALSLLTAVNLAFKGKGHKGCVITEAVMEQSDRANTSIMTISATQGDAAATMDDLRAAFKRGRAQ